MKQFWESFVEIVFQIVGGTLLTIWGLLVTILLTIMFAVCWLFGMRIRITKSGQIIGRLRWFTYTPIIK